MIFGLFAPLYWSKNIPVIPLHKFDEINQEGKGIGKAPIPKGWQNYHNSMPPEDLRKEWIEKYPDNNMGLPLGEQSGCVALDIDTNDSKIIECIDRIAPNSPWHRVGKKGKVCMFRYNGEKTFRIKDTSGQTICELLSSGTQVVLPPSIHPDTKHPYVASCELLNVIDDLPILPKEFEQMLRTAFQEELDIKLAHSGWTKTVDYVSQGERDVKMTSVAGIYAHAVLRGEMTVKEAIETFEAWCATHVEKVAGDNIDVSKGVRNLIKFLLNEVNGRKKKPLPKNWDNGLSQKEKEELGLDVSEDCVAWGYSEIIDYVQQGFEKHQDLDSQERLGVVEYALNKIARSPNLSMLEINKCFTFIANSNKGTPLPILRKRYMELISSGIVGMDHTEIAKAVLTDIEESVPNNERNTDREFDNIRYCNDKFWIWGGSHWKPLTQGEILKVISGEYGNLPAAKKNSDHMGIHNVMKSHVHNLLHDIDIKGVNFANGFVDVNGKIHQHSRKYGCTYTLPYRYLPELVEGSTDTVIVNAPKFTNFLKSVWGQEADYESRCCALREAMASTIFGCGPSFARAILLFGIAKSGKSQLLRIIEKLLPEEVVSYVTPYKFDSVFDSVGLSRSKLNICGELDETKGINGALFKQIVDGSEMEGRYLYGQSFKFKPQATHWFASNHLPKTKDSTEGFNRRWLILPFTKMVKKEEQIRDIGDLIVAEEREAIAAWAIEKMKTLQGRGDYTLPQSHFDTLNEMVSENDSLFFFLTSEEGPRLKADSSILTDKLYEKYRSFCYSVASARPVGLRKFYARLKEMAVLLGFTMDNFMVYGLTMEKGVGKPVRRENE